MKILEAQSAQLTNYEVHKHLVQLRDAKKLEASDKTAKKNFRGGRDDPGKRTIIAAPENLRTVARELLEYLEEAPSPLGSKPFPYNDQTAARLFTKLREFKLTKAEIQMIMNLRPNTPSALSTVIEEMETRFEDGEVQQKIVDAVLEVLGSPDGDAERQAMADNAKDAREAQDAKNKEELEGADDTEMIDS